MKRRYGPVSIFDAREALGAKNMGIVFQTSNKQYRVYFKRVPWKMSAKNTFIWDYETKDLAAAIRVGLAMAEAYKTAGENGLRTLFSTLK